jgi:hypothetical protein
MCHCRGLTWQVIWLGEAYITLGSRLSCLQFLARFRVVAPPRSVRFSALLSLPPRALNILPGPALTTTVLCNAAAQPISSWLSALRQPAHHRATPKCHTPSPFGYPPCGGQCTVASWRATTRCIPRSWPKAITAWRLPTFLAHTRQQATSFSEPARLTGGLRVFAGWPGAQVSGRIAVNSREFWRAKVKHLPTKQGLLVLTGCFFSPQPNVSVKPTPTSFTCGFPARFALRCGLPVALGFWLHEVSTAAESGH